MSVASPSYEEIDPFVFAVYHNHKINAGKHLSIRIRNAFIHISIVLIGQIAGFPPHAHRGFETITITIAGTIDHEVQFIY